VCRNNEQSGKCKTKLQYTVGNKTHNVCKLILHCLYKVQYIINLMSIWHFDLCYCRNIKGSRNEKSTSFYIKSSNLATLLNCKKWSCLLLQLLVHRQIYSYAFITVEIKGSPLKNWLHQSSNFFLLKLWYNQTLYFVATKLQCKCYSSSFTFQKKSAVIKSFQMD